MGGKNALAPLLYECFPLYYERYVEVCGGAGWLLFYKPPGNDFEVYNDYNPLLTNMFGCVRDRPAEFLESLRFSLNSRRDFERIRAHLTPEFPEHDVLRAAEFYQLIRYSYASGLTSYGSQPHDIWNDFPIIRQAHRRLGRVVIENKDFEKLIDQYDREVTLFYLDPPYYETEGYYQNIGKQGFTEADHIRMRDRLIDMKGKFLLSYNKHPFVFELYNRPGICIMPTSRLNNIKQRYEGGAMYEEYIIANYDLHEARGKVQQLNLFDVEGMTH